MAQTGESPELTLQLAQIFSYDLDFYTDPRKGDTFRVVLEKRKYADGKTAGYGKILAAEYNNGGRKYQALLFHDETGRPGYYTADGKALQKTFLRSPLKFAAPVTSHFSKARFHPILKRYRPHMGTDYGAPVGTPVQTIGSGRVTFAGRKGGEGNMVQIAHTNGYETMYLHLSRMYVRNGEHVEIGKTIGLVGSTGLSTGTTSWISGFCSAGSTEFREAGFAAVRSGQQEILAGVCVGARALVAIAAKSLSGCGERGGGRSDRLLLLRILHRTSSRIAQAICQ